MTNISIHNWRYVVEFGCGTDSWRLGGEVFGHPNYSGGSHVLTLMQVTTASGRVYQLGNCAGIIEEQLAYIREDIARGGTLLI